MLRRSSTNRPISPACKCKYFFLIHFDDKSFFVVPEIGNTTHSFHPKHGSLKCYLPPRLLDEVNKNFIEDMNSGSALVSTISNFLYFKTGSLMSRQNINYTKHNAEEIINYDIHKMNKHKSPSD